MEETHNLCLQIWTGLMELKERLYQIYSVMELINIPVPKSIADEIKSDLERSDAIASLVQEVSKSAANKAEVIFALFEELERSLK